MSLLPERVWWGSGLGVVKSCSRTHLFSRSGASVGLISEECSLPTCHLPSQLPLLPNKAVPGSSPFLPCSLPLPTPIKPSRGGTESLCLCPRGSERQSGPPQGAPSMVPKWEMAGHDVCYCLSLRANSLHSAPKHWSFLLTGQMSFLSTDFRKWWWNKASLATAVSSINCCLYPVAPDRYEVHRRRNLNALQFVVQT